MGQEAGRTGLTSKCCSQTGKNSLGSQFLEKEIVSSTTFGMKLRQKLKSLSVFLDPKETLSAWEPKPLLSQVHLYIGPAEAKFRPIAVSASLSHTQFLLNLLTVQKIISLVCWGFSSHQGDAYPASVVLCASPLEVRCKATDHQLVGSSDITLSLLILKATFSPQNAKWAFK